MSEQVSINRFERLMLNHFIKSRPDGATFTEVLEFLAQKQIGLGLKKRIPAVKDIVNICDYIVIRNCRLFFKDDFHELEKKVQKFNEVNKNLKIKKESVQKKVTYKMNIDAVDTSSESDSDSYECDGAEYTVKMEKNSDNVNDRVQKKLKDLIKGYPNGLWCLDLAEKYYEVYKSELNFRDHGYTSLIQMVLELPETFRCYQPTLSDWLLFDASAPLTDQERRIEINSQKKAKDLIPAGIKYQISKLLEQFCDVIGVNMEEIPALYYKKYGRRLEYELYGFESLKEFVNSLEGNILHVRKAGKSLYVIPITRKLTNAFRIEEAEDSNILGEAIPPVLPGDDLFAELFPENVFGPSERIPSLRVERYIEIGSRIEIVVADVWTPHRFFVQLKQYEQSLIKLSVDLENFYNQRLDQYKMPEPTVQPGQICGVYLNLQNVLDKCHRAEIVKTYNKQKVSVRLIDFGSVVYAKYHHLRFLPREFGDLPRLAIPASLTHLEPINPEKTWSESTNERFLELLGGPSMLMEVIDVNYEEPRVFIKLWDVLNKKKINISKILINEELANFSDEVFKFCKREKVKTKKQESKEVEGVKETNANAEFILPSRKTPFAPSKEISCKPRKAEKQLKHFDEVKEINADPPTETIPVTSSTSIDPSVSEDPTSQNPKTDSLSERLSNDSSTNISNPPQNLNFEQNKANISQPQPEFQIPLASVPASDNDTLLQYIQLVQTQMQLQNYQQQLLQQIQQQAVDEKRQINNLAVHFFNNNPYIKNIAILNPELALKLATNLAEEHHKNVKSVVNLQNAAATATATAAAVASATNITPTNLNHVNVGQSVQTEINRLSEKVLPLNIKEQIKFEVKEIEIEEYKVHIVMIDTEAFVCIDQMIQNFTPFSSRTNVDKVLSLKKQKFDYKILTRLEDESLFDELERYNSFRLGENDEEDILVLLPLRKIPQFFRTVTTTKESTKIAFNKLVENFN